MGSGLDRQILAEKVVAIERHLKRVASRLPADAADFKPATDASDVVILHLWQAVQLTIDLAMAVCLRLKLGTPENYGDAFVRLANHGFVEESLAKRLIRAAGFQNRVAHAYEELDMERVYRAATDGPDDLRAFLAAVQKAI